MQLPKLIRIPKNPLAQSNKPCPFPKPQRRVLVPGTASLSDYARSGGNRRRTLRQKLDHLSQFPTQRQKLSPNRIAASPKINDTRNVPATRNSFPSVNAIVAPLMPANTSPNTKPHPKRAFFDSILLGIIFAASPRCQTTEMVSKLRHVWLAVTRTNLDYDKTSVIQGRGLRLEFYCSTCIAEHDFCFLSVSD